MRIEDELHQTRFKSPYQRMALNLLFTAGWFNHLHSRWLKPHGLTPQQYNILRILRGQHPNPATIQLIRERMLDRMSNVSRLVERLRAKGLVERCTCPHDRRAVDVLITDAGLELLTTLDGSESHWLDALATLEPDEADRLNHLLDKLRG